MTVDFEEVLFSAIGFEKHSMCSSVAEGK